MILNYKIITMERIDFDKGRTTWHSLPDKVNKHYGYEED